MFKYIQIDNKIQGLILETPCGIFVNVHALICLDMRLDSITLSSLGWKMLAVVLGVLIYLTSIAGEIFNKIFVLIVKFIVRTLHHFTYLCMDWLLK